jgi:hypothetical protein
MKSIANTLSKLAIYIGLISFIVAIVSHFTGEIQGVGYWGFLMSGIFLELFAIALNSVELTETE